MPQRVKPQIKKREKIKEWEKFLRLLALETSKSAKTLQNLVNSPCRLRSAGILRRFSGEEENGKESEIVLGEVCFVDFFVVFFGGFPV